MDQYTKLTKYLISMTNQSKEQLETYPKSVHLPHTGQNKGLLVQRLRDHKLGS